MAKSLRLALALLIVLAGAGLIVYLATPALETRGEDWRRRHVQTLRVGLDDVRDLLLDYHKTHGRYPTNDEGLAALDNYESRFTVTAWRYKHGSSDELPLTGVFEERAFPALHGLALSDFRRTHGRAPKNADEFRSAFLVLGSSLQPSERDEYEPVEVEIAITSSDGVFMVSPAGLLSPLQIPYMYENRNGLDASLFADSPVGRDSDGRYSVHVDKGVYVYSVGGLHYAELIDKSRARRVRIALLLAALLVASTALLIWAARVKGGIIALAAMLGIGSLGYFASQVSCYVMSSLFRYRDPKIVVRQKELLEKQHASGIISDQTYERVLASLEPQKLQ